MDMIGYIQQMIDYHYWANNGVWNCIMGLSEEQFTQPLDYSQGSIRNQCVHLAGVDGEWFNFLHHANLDVMESDPADFQSREEVRALMNESEKIVRAYVATLTTEELNREFVRPFSDPPEKQFVWQQVMQIILHGVDHRAQILAALHQLGGQTIEQDFVYYVLEQTS